MIFDSWKLLFLEKDNGLSSVVHDSYMELSGY